MRKRIAAFIALAAGAGTAVLAFASGSSAQYPPYPTYPTTQTTQTYTQPPTMSTATTAPPAPAPAPAQNPASALSTGHTVTIGDNFFRPPKLTVKRGTVVTWEWTGMNPHNVTFTSLHKHSKTQTSGVFRLRFSKKGVYHYLCTIHRFKGTIVVH